MKKAFLLISFFFLQTHLGAEWFNFETTDGVQMVGEFLKPADSMKPVVILLHGLGSNRPEFEPFAKYLSQRGIGVLYYDLRGHGDSILKKNGQKVVYQSFTQAGWQNMVSDVGSAVKALEVKYKIPAGKIAVGGASVGANVAFRYAAQNRDAPFALLLSPGIDYQGVATHDVVPKYNDPIYLNGKRSVLGRPLLIAVSRGDGYSYQSAMALRTMCSNYYIPLRLFEESPTAGHGVQLFQRASPDKPSLLEQKIVSWILKVYGQK